MEETGEGREGREAVGGGFRENEATKTKNSQIRTEDPDSSSEHSNWRIRKAETDFTLSKNDNTDEIWGKHWWKMKICKNTRKQGWTGNLAHRAFSWWEDSQWD